MKHFSQLAVLALVQSAVGQIVNGPEYDSPNGGPPASFFAAASTMPVAALQAAAAQASVVPSLATYPVSHDNGAAMSTIHSDWASFSQGAAISWVADMDVDCDGLDYQCEGNPDGQPNTNWGALAAYEVPFIVIPDQYLSANPEALPGNNVVAVICNGKMFYGILGDSNGNSPQVTGEASWLMARTCFPNEGLSGIKGHSAVDVTYIVFTGPYAVLPSTAVNANYLTDFTTLRSMGDSLVNALASTLGLSGTLPTKTTTLVTTTTTKPTSTCSWAGHCAGAPCSTHNDCSDSLACKNGICAVDGATPCTWEGHCEGAPCSSNDECSDDLYCKNGSCTAP